MATHTYKIQNNATGLQVGSEIANVLAPVALSGVEVTTGSPKVTVASTAGLYVGMGLAISGLPYGSFIRSVESTTVLVAAVSSVPTSRGWITTTAYTIGDQVLQNGLHWHCTVAHTAGTWITDRDAGKWTLNLNPRVVPANASETLSGKLGLAMGFNPVQVMEPLVDGSLYRDALALTGGSLQMALPLVGSQEVILVAQTLQAGGLVPTASAVMTPTISTGANQALALSEAQPSVQDEAVHLPWRAKVKYVGYYYFIHTGGVHTKIPAKPENQIILTTITA